jgi:Cdc6-like AAA superfamily ATPase
MLAYIPQLNFSQFVDGNAAGSGHSEGSSKPTGVTYQLTSLTTLRLLDPIHSSVSNNEPQADIASSSCMPYFGGYTSQRDQVWSLLKLGLGLDMQSQFSADGHQASTLPASFFTPPKGLLLHGPRGTGKTLLMNEMADSLKSKCHILRVSHDILLSK